MSIGGKGVVVQLEKAERKKQEGGDLVIFLWIVLIPLRFGAEI